MSLQIVSITASRQIRAALAHVKSHRDLFELDVELDMLEKKHEDAERAMQAEFKEESRKDKKQLVEQIGEQIKDLKAEYAKTSTLLTKLASSTCRSLGCNKSPRGRRKVVSGRKAKRKAVVCRQHAGIANMISRKLRATLDTTPLLRIVPPAA